MDAAYLTATPNSKPREKFKKLIFISKPITTTLIETTPIVTMETHFHYNTLTIPKPTNMSYGYDAPYDDYSQIKYAQPHPDFDLVIHPNSAAARLGFSPEEMAPILQEQQELMATMSYEPEQQYEHPPTECAQPHADPYFVHPNSAAAQLGLTPEEIREVVDEQERWFREEYQQELEEDRAWVSTEHQEQQQHQHLLQQLQAIPFIMLVKLQPAAKVRGQQ